MIAITILMATISAVAAVWLITDNVKRVRRLEGMVDELEAENKRLRLIVESNAVKQHKASERIKTQQGIIDKLNAKLGIERKQKGGKA